MTSPRTIRARTTPLVGGLTGLASWLLAVLVLVALVLMRWVGERWWPVSLLLFAPRWPWLVPLPVLVVAAAWARRRALWGLHAVLAVVILGPLAGFTVPLHRLGDATPEGVRVTILSFNLGQDPIDVHRLIELVEREQVQVVCLQEPENDEGLGTLFEERGWSRSRGGMIYSRWPIVDELPRLPDWNDPAQDLYDGRLSRVRVRADSGAEFLVASVHAPTLRMGFERLRDGDVAGLKRHIAWCGAQIDRVAGALRSASDLPVLVGGDFNLPREALAMAPLRRGFRFAFEEAGWGFGYTRPSRFPWIRIDHILTSPEWAITRCWVGPDLGSDHLPVLADVVLRREPSGRDGGASHPDVGARRPGDFPWDRPAQGMPIANEPRSD